MPRKAKNAGRGQRKADGVELSWGGGPAPAQPKAQQEADPQSYQNNASKSYFDGGDDPFAELEGKPKK